MVIRLMTVRNFLLPELLQQLAVGMIYRTDGRWLLLDNASHVVQKPGYRMEQQGRRMIIIPLPCWRSLRRWSGGLVLRVLQLLS